MDSDCTPSERSAPVWGSVIAMDRGDAPAQVVIEKNLKAQSERRMEETKEQLHRITNRVEEAMAAFELDEKLMKDNKAAFFVPDLIELEKIIKDTIQKRKYQQEVTIFIVGYESKSGERLKLLSQINDFFSAYINTIDDEALTFKPTVEIEMDEISSRVQEALETASSAAKKLTDIGHDVFTFAEKLHGNKAASKSKKKLEKALMQAKDDIMNLTEKLMGAQTEIEEKEDQMTRLYKQIDMKNLEVAKYKNNAEMAKKSLGQVDDLKLEIKEKEDEIEKLHRSMADRELSTQQIEQSREASMVKLRAANEENEQTIDKLQTKITTLQVQLDESRIDLQKHHESTVVSLKHQHNAEVEAVKTEYQEKINKLEEELQNKVKHWAPDSDDESEKPNFSRKSSQLDLSSRKSNRNIPPSRQSSNVQKKLDSISRQNSSIGATSAQETPKPSPKQTPETPKTPSTDSLKASKSNTPKVAPLPSEGSETGTKVANQKRNTRTKSNLEPVHEVPFEEKIPIDDEAKWDNVPQEKLPSAFKQYRKEALFVVQGLQNEIKAAKDDSHKKITMLKSQAKESEEHWKAEKHMLVQKVELVEKLKTEAEKSADEAVAQLENFVKEQGRMAKAVDEDSKEKKLKKLTPEQRLKYFGPEKSVLPVENKEPVNKPMQNGVSAVVVNEDERDQLHDEERTALNSEAPSTAEGLARKALDHEMQTSPILQAGRSQQTSRLESCGHQDLVDRLMATGSLKKSKKVQKPSEDIKVNSKELKDLINTTTQTDPWEAYSQVPDPPNPKSSPSLTLEDSDPRQSSPPFGPSAPPLSRESDCDADVDSDAFSERSLAIHLSRALADLTLSDEGEEEEEHHQSSRSQRSLYEKYHAQLEQKKVEIVERRSRATSMHGSLLSAKSQRQGTSPRNSRIATPTVDGSIADEVDKMDAATSPVAFSIASKTSKHSAELTTDHPVIEDYLRVYSIIIDFKESLITALKDKDLLTAAERLSDIDQLTYDHNLNIQNQVYEMTTNVMNFLKEAANVINSYLFNDLEPAVSSLVITQGETVSLTRECTEDKIVTHAESFTDVTPAENLEVNELKKNYENLKLVLEQQKKDYEDNLNNNAVMMMELQDTIQELQHELSAFGGSPMKPFSAVSGISGHYDKNAEPTIIFSRMDSERNQKALKRAVNAHKLNQHHYSEVVQAMDQYTILPAKRFVHLAKKYTHHMHMKQIEENVKRSNCLDEEVYALLERMEDLQSLRAQRWGEQMDNLTSERLRLAHMLMEALRRVEEESGIFMIKPILSWKRRDQIPFYQRRRISDNYHPRPFLKPITPLRDGSPHNMVPAPTPASHHPIKSALMRPQTQESVPAEPPSEDPTSDVPIKGSSIQLVGTQPQPMWAMSSSFVHPGGGDSVKDRVSMVTTPRMLELDVNRMMIGQNTVSALTKAVPPCHDRLINASNASVRSYMTINRPSAISGQNDKQARPKSTGTEGSRSSPTAPVMKAPNNSAGSSRQSRALSEGALSLSQPLLPPIRVPPTNTPVDGVRSRPGTTGSTGSDSSLYGKDTPRPTVHPSPPHTPPGSSLRQSPPLMNTTESNNRDNEEEDTRSLGHVTKISMHAVSQEEVLQG